MKSIEFHLLFFFIILPMIFTDDQRIICYYTNWSVYRHTVVPVLYPDDIDPLLCTHIHFAFASIDPLTLMIEYSENHDIHFTNIFSTPLYIRLYSLKQMNPSIKLLIAVGGWSAGSESFNNILTNSTTRQRFIENTKEFLIKWKFDGIDIDWEYPGDIDRGAKNDSRKQFNILIKEMRQSFEDDSHPFLLTAAVSASPRKIDQGYIVSEFCQYLDYVSIMTYDYHGGWDNVTGMNAPLYEKKLEDNDDDEKRWNVNGSVYYWLDNGCPPDKINLGLAMYGRSFTIVNDSVDIGTTVLGSGLAGPYTKENGTLAYFEICQKLRVSNWTTIFDSDTEVPYAYSPLMNNMSTRQWVGFDDLKSVTLKVLYAQSLDLGGVMLWSLDQDDYTGLFCDQGKFPLTQRIHDVVRSSTNLKKYDLIDSPEESIKHKIDPISVKINTIDDQKLTPTQLSSDWRMLNSSVKNIYSFYLFILVLLFI